MIEKIENLKNYIPKHARLLLLAALGYNLFVYYFSRLIVGEKPHIVVSCSIDSYIPLVEWTVVIYFGCYLFWAINYILCTRFDKLQAQRFVFADLLGKTVCLFFFIFVPTTMKRPDIVGEGIFCGLMRFLYAVDSPDNLFPSIHCFVSWMCYIGMRGDERYSLKYRIFSCVFAIAVFISTLTTKQHAIADVIAGMLLAECCFFITKKFHTNTH